MRLKKTSHYIDYNRYCDNTGLRQKLINQFKAIENMDEEDRNVVKKLIDAFITKKQLQKMMQ